MAKGWVHTVHQDGSWYNEIEGEGRLATAHRSKRDAVETGRMLARFRVTEHLIHNLEGTISERNSYGSDPYPPPG